MLWNILLVVAHAILSPILLSQIFPALRNYAKEHGASGTPVVLTTCSIKESTCTHFVVGEELDFVELFHCLSNAFATVMLTTKTLLIFLQIYNKINNEQ
jgi:hypothetical protein